MGLGCGGQGHKPDAPDGGRKAALRNAGAQPAPQRRRLRPRQAHGTLWAVGRRAGGRAGLVPGGGKGDRGPPTSPGLPPTPAQSQYFQCAVCCRAVCGQWAVQGAAWGQRRGLHPPCQTPPCPPAWFLFWTPAPGPHQPHRCSSRRGTSQLRRELQGCWGRGPGAGFRLRTAVLLCFLIKPLLLWPRQGC